MGDVKTNAKFLEELRSSAGRAMTAEEIRRQRESFIMGSVSDKSSMTREQVRRILDEREGRKAS